MITKEIECDDAAQLLNLPSTYPRQLQFGDRPHGCIIRTYQDGSNFLVWAPPELHPYPNVPCSGTYYGCICAKYGK